MSVDEARARCRVVEAQHELRQRRLTGPVSAGDSHRFTGSDLEGQVAQNCRPRLIGKTHMVERDMAFQIWSGLGFSLFFELFGLDCEKLHDALATGGGLADSSRDA